MIGKFTISGLIEAMSRVAARGKDCDLVSKFLQSDGRVYD